MKYLIFLACIAFALAQPLNEKRFFNIFGGDDPTTTTEDPNKAIIEDLKDQLELVHDHLSAHSNNTSNSTNVGLDRIADVLENLVERGSSEIKEIEGDLEGVRQELEEQLSRSAQFLRDGKVHLGKIHQDFHEEFDNHLHQIQNMTNQIKSRN